jgi:hypothetical protein
VFYSGFLSSSARLCSAPHISSGSLQSTARRRAFFCFVVTIPALLSCQTGVPMLTGPYEENGSAALCSPSRGSGVRFTG